MFLMSFLISAAGIAFDCGDLSQLNCLLFVCADGFLFALRLRSAGRAQSGFRHAGCKTSALSDTVGPLSRLSINFLPFFLLLCPFIASDRNRLFIGSFMFLFLSRSLRKLISLNLQISRNSRKVCRMSSTRTSRLWHLGIQSKQAKKKKSKI